ncbi:hypothetical protein RF11_01148 [Thelohanellus kitauei]|uniref:Sortilin C-terminal domain-containing protein n=1 Tax=Thelohanellus kitauei TaxID=669202 RepID=A0A0C2J5A3_THEKT|nr:hypothetical protein RF11_01148 [Thelohanellus kitauei]
MSLYLMIPQDLITYRRFPVPWIALFDGIYGNSAQSEFISMDGGFNWDLTPFPVFKAVVLNQGGVIIGINPYNNRIVYTYGHDNWFSASNGIQRDEITIIYPSTPKPMMFLNIIGTMIGRQHSTFLNIDFSNVFNRPCTADDFESWSPYVGMNRPILESSIYFLRIKPSTYCAVNYTYEAESA